MKSSTSGFYDECDIGYADDLMLSSWSSDDLQTLVTTLHDVLLDFGLQMNLSKTETMILNWNDKMDGTYPISIIQLNQEDLQNTKYFKYLGVWITYNDFNIGNCELQNRINSAKGAFVENKKLSLKQSHQLTDKNHIHECPGKK